MYRIVVPKQLKEIWEAAENGFFPGDPLGKVAKKNYRSLKGVFNNLERTDVLVEAIYGKPGPDGKLVFPMVDEPDSGVEPHRGFLGDQSSYWHGETLREHACMVAATLHQAGLQEKLAAFLGVFHDCGKKYTAGTNHAGEVWFPEHELVSAFLTASWTKYWSLTEAERKLLVAVVYGHMQYHFEWKSGTAKGARAEKKYIEECTDFLGGEQPALRAFGLTTLLGASDVGAKNGAPKDKELIRAGRALIDKF